MSRVFKIKYNNKVILYVDGKDASREESIEGINEYFKILKTYEPGTALVLIDMTNAEGGKEVLKILKDHAHISDKFVKKAADVGVTGIKKILFNSYIAFTMLKGKNIGYRLKIVDTVKEAKDWLTTD